MESLRSKMDQRRYIQHSYRDHSQTSPERCEEMFTAQSFHSCQNEAAKEKERLNSKKYRGETSNFPSKLHGLLRYTEQNKIAHIVSWQIHGRAFKIHKPKDFMEKVAPIYFQQTKLASFRRQLNLYGFLRISHGPDKGSYYNEFFLRGKSFLTRRIVRRRVKGKGLKGISNPERVPDFYNMPFMDNLGQGQSEPALSSTSSSFGLEYTAMPMPTNSTEYYLSARGEVINPRSCCSPERSAFEMTLKDKNIGRIFNVDTCLKIDQLINDEWDLDTFSFEDTIFHDYMKDDSSQEGDVWGLP